VSGLLSRARLRIVELPLSTRSILAGIKTAAVINVGTATLSAIIGAGGNGQPILTGIRLDDFGLILQGATPAAVLAFLVQGLFDLIERGLIPKSLRNNPGEGKLKRTKKVKEIKAISGYDITNNGVRSFSVPLYLHRSYTERSLLAAFV